MQRIQYSTLGGKKITHLQTTNQYIYIRIVYQNQVMKQNNYYQIF